ncbi:MAG: pantoate--beta-alanine ligase [Ignavibacteria bacterium]|nr:pantoate--beta-alanine ligase [Ignavibacteria bacterium]
MKLIKDIKALQSISDYFRATVRTIGFVPTMGYLHDGHISLLQKARMDSEIVVASIFVNPTQFSPTEDFNEYPRDFLRDYHICRNYGVDYIFYPDTKSIYPDDFLTEVYVKDISDRLEGTFRPRHFIGVTTVVAKLINIVKPHFVYLGQKDAQQAIIIKKMCEDLNIDIEIKICPTVREKTGLALSSRNTYLNDDEKTEASILYEALNEGKKMILDYKVVDTESIKKYVSNYISRKSKNIKLQYFAITDNYLMNEIENLKNYKGEVVLSLAAYLGKTRLIDNILFNYNN